MTVVGPACSLADDAEGHRPYALDRKTCSMTAGDGRAGEVGPIPLDFVHLRAVLEGWNAPDLAGAPVAVIDHVFPVKGVGTVALGVVRQGTIRAHERHRLWPTPKEVEVRSIQVHDVDRKDAGCGERVGLALKGVEADEVSRGMIVAPAGSLSEGAHLATGPFEKCRYYRGAVAAGDHLHLSVGLQVVPVVVEQVGVGGGRLETDRPVVYRPNDPGLLLDLSAPTGPRVAGRLTLTGPA